MGLNLGNVWPVIIHIARNHVPLEKFPIKVLSQDPGGVTVHHLALTINGKSDHCSIVHQNFQVNLGKHFLQSNHDMLFKLPSMKNGPKTSPFPHNPAHLLSPVIYDCRDCNLAATWGHIL